MIDYTTLIVPAAFILLDIVTGITQAAKNKTLSSVIMRQGIYHKLGYIMTIALAALCEWGIIYLDLGFTTPLITPVCIMITLTETLSILENIARINPELEHIGIFDLFGENKKRRADDVKE